MLRQSSLMALLYTRPPSDHTENGATVSLIYAVTGEVADAELGVLARSQVADTTRYPVDACSR